MCGIVGYIGEKQVVPVLVEGLRKLEYRGYDSAGVAVVRSEGIEVRRSAGKLSRLEDVLKTTPLAGDYGIGHTRWATHGRPTEENAHPHRDDSGRTVVVHNGIIENYLELKHELIAEGHKFQSETDTEIVAHMVARELKNGAGSLEVATQKMLARVRGLFALVLMSSDDPDKIVAVRNGPPIVVGIGDQESFVASDIPAILSHTRDVVFLEDGEMAVLTRQGVAFTDFEGKPRTRKPQRVTWDPVMAEKGGYKHFMLKEIFEQPWAVRETVLGRVSEDTGAIFLDEMRISPEDLRGIRRVVMLACGTSWHSALIGKFMIEQLARLPVEVDYGSEYRYRDPIVGPETLAVVITQSGETADTLAALREAKAKGARSMAICNVVGSHGDARDRRHRLHPRRARDRRGVDQGVHVAARRAAHPRALPGAGARHDRREGKPRAHRGAGAAAAADRGSPEVRRADRGDRQALLPVQRLPVSRARHPVPDRARRRAEAEGDLVHPRRGLSRPAR